MEIDFGTGILSLILTGLEGSQGVSASSFSTKATSRGGCPPEAFSIVSSSVLDLRGLSSDRKAH